MAVLGLARRLCPELPSDFTEEWEDGRHYGEPRVWRAVFNASPSMPTMVLLKAMHSVASDPWHVAAQDPLAGEQEATR